MREPAGARLRVFWILEGLIEMTRVTIGEREFLLKFDMKALEDIEEEFDGLDGLMAAMDGKHRTRSARTVFRILANRGEASQKRAETITGEEVYGLTMAEMATLMTLIRREIEGGKKTKIRDPEEEAEKAAAMAMGGMIIDANALGGGDEKNAETGIG